MIDVNVANFVTIGLISVGAWAVFNALIQWLAGMGISIPFLSPPVAA